MWKKLKMFLRDEEGASAVEYGLIVGLIAVALVAVLVVLGGDQGLRGLFQTIVDALPGASGGG
jgi:pilus assembly protein Flp/PilA